VSRYIIDSYALLAYYWREPGFDQVRQLLLQHASRHWVSVVNLGEAYYRIAREEDVGAAEVAWTWMLGLPVVPVAADLELAQEAARFKASYPLAYADCFAAALAQHLNARVVTGDPEFEQLERDGVIEVEWLVRKPRRRR
jgi:ribonuclease VapC